MTEVRENGKIKFATVGKPHQEHPNVEKGKSEVSVDQLSFVCCVTEPGLAWGGDVVSY